MTQHKNSITNIEVPITTGDSQSILANLFRKILSSNDVRSDRFNSLLERYITRANIPSNIKEVSSVRGNLKKELTKTSMSWKVFIKGIKFLGVKRFDLIIRLHMFDGSIQEHVQGVQLDLTEPFTFEDEDE